MVLLSVQGLLRHKQREAGVLDAQLLDLRVEEGRDGLPDEERAGPQDVAACRAKSGSNYLRSLGANSRFKRGEGTNPRWVDPVSLGISYWNPC